MDIRITSWGRLRHHPLNSAQYRNVPQELSGTAAADGTEWDWWATADRTGAEIVELNLRVGPAEDDVEYDIFVAVKKFLDNLVGEIIDAEEAAALEVMEKYPRGNG